VRCPDLVQLRLAVISGLRVCCCPGVWRAATDHLQGPAEQMEEPTPGADMLVDEVRQMKI